MTGTISPHLTHEGLPSYQRIQSPWQEPAIQKRGNNYHGSKMTSIQSGRDIKMTGMEVQQDLAGRGDSLMTGIKVNNIRLK